MYTTAAPSWSLEPTIVLTWLDNTAPHPHLGELGTTINRQYQLYMHTCTRKEVFLKVITAQQVQGMSCVVVLIHQHKIRHPKIDSALLQVLTYDIILLIIKLK